MFSLSEIKGIRKKYKLNENGAIELTGKEVAKNPNEMTEEEKSYIQSALFLYKKVRLDKSEEFNEISDEEFLEQIQTQFVSEALNRTYYKINITSAFFKSTDPSYIIWKSIVNDDAGAMAYFNRALAENGKRVQIFQKSAINGLVSNIRYYLADDNKGKFQQSLNPNNPIYTQNPKPLELTPEQKQKRRQFVDLLMQVYKQCEKDDNYENRKQTEESDMDFIADTVGMNGHFRILSKTASVRVMNLLYAAQNLSLDGQTDYLEALIEKPEISDFLLHMRNNNILDRMQKKAQERKDNGTISKHKPTHGEIAIRNANALIKEHPNAVEVATRKLTGRPTFTIKNGDTENLRRAYLLEIIARTHGRYISRSTDENGNKILAIDSHDKVLQNH